MKNFILTFLLAMVIAGCIYGSYWVAKNLSYAIFYEDLVIETMRDTLKPECFK